MTNDIGINEVYVTLDAMTRKTDIQSLGGIRRND